MRGEVFTTLVWKYVSLSSSYTKGCQSRQVSQSLRLSSSHMISHLGSSIKSRSPIPSSIIVKLGTTLLCERWAKNGDLESGERTPGENRSLLLVIQHFCDTKFEYNGTIKYFLAKNSNCLDLLPWSGEAKKKGALNLKRSYWIWEPVWCDWRLNQSKYIGPPTCFVFIPTLLSLF
jgi:hypothetical protein